MLIEQTRGCPQKTLEFRLNKQLETLIFSPPINLVEGGKWLLTVTSFETTNSVFNITDENNSFSISTPSCSSPEGGEELDIQLNKLLEVRSENYMESQVKDVKKRRTRIELEISGYNLTSFDHFESEKIAELKRVTYKDLADMVYRTELTYDKIIDISDVEYIAASTVGCKLPPGTNEISDVNSMVSL